MRVLTPAVSSRSTIKLLGVVVLAFLLAGCSSAEEGSAPTGPAVSATAGPGADSPSPADEPGCEELGYPCNLASTPPELIERTKELLAGARERLAASGYESALEFLEDQPDIVDAFGDAVAITFRVEGAPPAWLVDHTGVGEDPQAMSALARPGTATMLPASVVGRDTTGDGVTDNRDAKHALVLAPYMWQFAPNDESDLVAERLGALKPYEGNVTLHANRARRDQVVTAQDWQQLDRYDAIFIATHGYRRCRTSSDGSQQCRTMVQTGVHMSQFDLDTSGTLSGFAIIQSYDADNPQSSQDFELGVDTRFFSRNYPDGLDDTLLVLSACETGSISGDLLAASAGGDDFVMMAWTDVVPSRAAFAASGILIEQLSLGVTSELAYQEVIDLGLASAFTGRDQVTALEHISPRGDEVRLLEVPTLLHEGEPMPDGSDLSDRVTGTPGDGNPDTIELDLKLIGIDDPTRYQVLYEVNGNLALGAYGLENATPGSLPYEYTLTHRVDLGDDLPAGDIELSAIVQLPEGGESRYTANVTVGREPGALIRVGGQSWEFELTSFFGASCDLGPNDDKLVTGGFEKDNPNGATFAAHIEPDGRDVEGLFSVHGITVSDPETGSEWMADELEFPSLAWLEAIPPGGSQIDTLTIENGRATGTATFYDVRAAQDAWLNNTAPPMPVTGSFDIQCGAPGAG